MNKTLLTGRICQNIELKQTKSGLSVCSFTLAVKRPKTNDTTDFLNVACWRQNAEYLYRYADKGSLIEVAGVLTSRKFTDQNGKNHTAIEVVADEVSILANVQQGNGDTESQSAPTFTESTPQFEEISMSDDNLPF